VPAGIIVAAPERVTAQHLLYSVRDTRQPRSVWSTKDGSGVLLCTWVTFATMGWLPQRPSAANRNSGTALRRGLGPTEWLCRSSTCLLFQQSRNGKASVSSR